MKNELSNRSMEIPMENLALISMLLVGLAGELTLLFLGFLSLVICSLLF
jgi:hypothetical protein